jgi:16S rRNA (guanine1516-N2)-methyltransferase
VSTAALPLIITTSRKASAETIDHARQRSADWGLVFTERLDRSTESLLGDTTAALVFANDGLHLATQEGRLKHHLGTAYIRLKSLERGDGDPLVRAGDLRPGDQVLDTTFGLGRDAAVAARVLGPTGSVVGFESSPALFYLAHETMLSEEADERSAPIELLLSDSRTHLKACPDATVDVVLIDPMFTKPKTSDSGFSLLRAVADPTSLDQEWVEQARRVARRWVVVKSGEHMPWFDAAGLEQVHSHSNATWYRSPPLALR